MEWLVSADAFRVRATNCFVGVPGRLSITDAIQVRAQKPSSGTPGRFSVADAIQVRAVKRSGATSGAFSGATGWLAGAGAIRVRANLTS